MQHPLGDRSATIRHLLAVIEHQQHPTRTDRLGDGRFQCTRRLLRYTQDFGQCAWQHGRIDQRGQLHQPHAVGDVSTAACSLVVRDPHGQARLTSSADAHQRDQRGGLQQTRHVRHGRRAPDQRAQLARQIVGYRIRPGHCATAYPEFGVKLAPIFSSGTKVARAE